MKFLNVFSLALLVLSPSISSAMDDEDNSGRVSPRYHGLHSHGGAGGHYGYHSVGAAGGGHYYGYHSVGAAAAVNYNYGYHSHGGAGGHYGYHSVGAAAAVNYNYGYHSH